MQKVLIITYYWPPSGGAGVQRWLKFARYLPDLGWEPIVLTVEEQFASYPQIDKSLLEEAKSVKVFRTKSFELYNLYSGMKKDKQIPFGGFSNEDNPSFLQQAARFVRGNFFLPDPRKGWNRYALKKAMELIKEYDIKTVITTSPPHSTQLIGCRIKYKFPHIKWIADLRDPWTDIYYYDKFYPTAISRAIDKGYEKRVIQKADKVLVVSQSLKKVYDQRYAVGNKIEIVTNGFDEIDFLEKPSSSSNIKQEVLYTGTMTDDYPMDELMALIEKLSELKFRFIGNSPEKFKQKIVETGFSNRVIFQKSVLHSEIVLEMQSAAYLLLLIPKVKNNEGILTGKLFEYLASGRPIIAVGPNNGDAEKILNDTKRGIYIEYDNIHNLEESAVLQRNYFEEKSDIGAFSRKKIAEKMVQYMERN